LHFSVNPTTWALKASPDLRLEARKALLQDSRGMEVRLYLIFARRYVRKFVFQIDGALLGMASNLRGKFCDFPHVGHYLSPTTRADKPHRTGRTGPFSKTRSMLGLRGEPGPRKHHREERRRGYIPNALRTQHRWSAFRVC
jgi:hypothetical protein